MMSTKKYTITEMLTFSKTNDPEFPYSVTVSNDMGLSQTIWFDEMTMGVFSHYFSQMRGTEKDKPYSFIVTARRSYER